MFLFGPLADAFGRKRMLIIGLTGYSIFSGLLAVTQDDQMFLIHRALQAIFGGAATLVIPGTIRLLFGKDTVKGLSYVSTIMMIAPMLAPTLGGVLLELSDWRLIFWALCGYSVLILVLSLRYFPNVELAVDDVEASDDKQNAQSEKRPGLKELYFSTYQRILANKSTLGFLVVSMLGSFTFFTYVTGISFIYITLFGVSEMMFGILFGLNVIVLMFANLSNARLAPKIGSVKMMGYMWGGATICASLLLISVVLDAGIHYVVLSLLPIMGCLLVILINSDTLILQKFAKNTGTASAVIGTLRFGSGALAGPFLTFFYDGSALPFAGLIITGVLCIGVVHFCYNRKQPI